MCVSVCALWFCPSHISQAVPKCMAYLFAYTWEFEKFHVNNCCLLFSVSFSSVVFVYLLNLGGRACVCMCVHKCCFCVCHRKMFCCLSSSQFANAALSGPHSSSPSVFLALKPPSRPISSCQPTERAYFFVWWKRIHKIKTANLLWTTCDFKTVNNVWWCLRESVR